MSLPTTGISVSISLYPATKPVASFGMDGRNFGPTLAVNVSSTEVLIVYFIYSLISEHYISAL